MNKMNLLSPQRQTSYPNAHQSYVLSFPVIIKKAILCIFIAMTVSTFVRGQIYVHGPSVNGTGPWAPAITTNGQAVTGNALQSLDNGVTFDPALDGGFAQGFPFALLGMILPPLNISCPPDLSLSCSDVIPPGATTSADFMAQGGAISSGNAATVSFADTPTGSCGAIERTYTVDDGTDMLTCVQLIAVSDSQAPDIGMCPTSLTNLTCFENPPAAATTFAEFIAQGGSVSDNCTDVDDLIFVSSIGNNGNSFCDTDGAFVITRTYTIIDACGNGATCEQTFTYLESTVGPVITGVLPTCYKNCIESANPDPNNLEYTTDCSFGATVTVSDPVEDGSTNCPETSYTYTYTVTDDCGKTATATQVIITNNPGPTITCPSFNLILECNDPNNDMYIATQLSQISATSSCSMDLDVTNDYSGLVFGNCTNSTDVVVFTATDACGRTATCTSTITILDNEPPVITEVPPSVCDAIECGAVNADYWFDHWIQYMLDGLLAIDQCDANVTWSTIPANPQLNEVCDPISGDAVTIVTFVATDNCSNTTTITGTFIIENDFPPAYENVPPDDTVSCGNPIVFGTPPTLVDECQATEEVMTTVNDSDPCNVLHIRTWTATDLCGGLSTSVTQTITETDEDAPVISGGGNITVECDGNDNLTELQIWLDDNAGASAADPCGNGENWTNDFDPSNIVTTADCADGIYSYVDVAFTATDNCGNSSSVSFRFNSTDTTAPMFDAAPQDGVIACDESPVFDNVTATDICSGAASVSDEDSSTGDACAGSYTRTWTATDACGNMATVSQTFTYSDNEAPVFTIVPSGGSFDCLTDVTFGGAAATDNCNAVTITFNDSDSGDDCSGTYIRTWTATDACGNSATASATVTYDDDVPPVFTSVPGGGTYECAADAVFDEPAATDNCNDVTITSSDEVTGDGCTGSVIRTYTATDACGNTQTASATVSYDDDVPPVFTSVPSGGTYECATDAVFDEPAATDNCNDVTITSTDEITGDGCTGSVIRTYTATDACGNTQTASAMVAYDDNEPPVFTFVPSGGNFQCAIDAEFEEPTAEDNCNFVAITSEDVEVGGACNGFVTRTWTATDACGNSTTTSATATYEDTEPPEFTFIPTDGTLSCDDELLIDDAEATDNCSLTLTSSDEVTGSTCVGMLTRTWTAIDACGNSSTASATITYVDDVPPEFTITPDGGDFECLTDVAFDNPTVIDNCNTVDVDFSDDINGNSCFGSVIRIWTATDFCGNASTASATATYEDDVPPVFTVVPADANIACDVPPVFGEPEATDLCNSVVVIFTDDIFGDACVGGYIRTWTATDACGNTSTASQALSYEDTEAPVFTLIPSGGVVACLSDVVFGDPELTDDCNLITVVTNDVTNGDDCTGGVERTWTATDACGNLSTASATIMIDDDEAPVFTFIPGSEAYDCLSEVVWGTATAMDNCNNAAVTFTDNVVGDDCSGTVTRTWTATDDCGNMSTTAVTSIYEDYDPPVFTSVPSGEIIECFDDTMFEVPTATDNCVDPVFTFDDEIIGTFCDGSINRTWTATDACGNTATAVQTITVMDMTPPVLSGVPVDLTVECDQVPAPANVTVTDNCDLDVLVEFNEILNPGPCPQTYTLIRTWSAADDCDNFISMSQTINVEDTQAPFLAGVPLGGAFECDNAPGPGNVFTMDNCDMDVPVVLTETRVDGDCPYDYTLTRTWVAEDDCGNMNSATQTLDISDNTPPEITCTPSTERSLNNPFVCELLDFLPIQATDNCSEFDSIMISWTTDFGNDGTIDTMGVKNNGTNLALIFPIGVNVTVFTATDECGNSVTCSTTLEVIDNVPPAFFCISQTETLNAEGVVSTAAIDYVFEPFNECCVDTILFDIGPPGNPILVDSIEWDCDDSIMDFPNGVDTKVTVFDCYGNSASCITKTIILIPEGSTICDEGPPGFANIMGTIYTEEVELVEDVTVNLNGGMTDSYLTSTDGTYGFDDLATGNNYTVTPEMDIAYLNGVSTYDLVLISKHILEIQMLDSPYKMIAADINKSGSITTLDMVELRKVILFIDEEFPNNTSWRFVEADFVFPVPTNPFASTFPEEANINGLQYLEQHDFVGVKIGDVNGTVVPNNLVGGDDRSFNGALHFDVEDKMLEAGEQYEVVFRSADFESIAGYQYTLNFDVNKLDFYAVEPGALPGMSTANFGLSLLKSGAITTSWMTNEPISLNAGVELFRITFTAKQAGRLSDVLFVNSRFTPAEAYDVSASDGQLSLLNVDLRFEGDEEAKFVLYQNTPNPFRDETLIGFNLPEASTATLIITDVSGRVLYQVEGDFVKGYNSVDIDASTLGTRGVVYYRLVTPTRHATKKMILLED